MKTNFGKRQNIKSDIIWLPQGNIETTWSVQNFRFSLKDQVPQHLIHLCLTEISLVLSTKNLLRCFRPDSSEGD